MTGNFFRRVWQTGAIECVECFISLPEIKKLHNQVKRRVKPAEDNVRFYWIAADCLPRTLTIGSNPPQPPPQLYIV
jgi:CRISPR-associated protein Cas2